MARTISGAQSIGANAVVAQLDNVNTSTFNPVQQTSRVSVYAASSAAGINIRLVLGADIHAEDVTVQAATLSTRDHLVATGVALRGQKITLGARNTTAGALTLNYYVVIEPIGA